MGSEQATVGIVAAAGVGADDGLDLAALVEILDRIGVASSGLISLLLAFQPIGSTATESLMTVWEDQGVPLTPK
jgi:hypothetical protein